MDQAFFDALAADKDLGATRGIDATLQAFTLDALLLPTDVSSSPAAIAGYPIITGALSCAVSSLSCNTTEMLHLQSPSAFCLRRPRSRLRIRRAQADRTSPSGSLSSGRRSASSRSSGWRSRMSRRRTRDSHSLLSLKRSRRHSWRMSWGSEGVIFAPLGAIVPAGAKMSIWLGISDPFQSSISLLRFLPEQSDFEVRRESNSSVQGSKHAQLLRGVLDDDRGH